MSLQLLKRGKVSAIAEFVVRASPGKLGSRLLSRLGHDEELVANKNTSNVLNHRVLKSYVTLDVLYAKGINIEQYVQRLLWTETIDSLENRGKKQNINKQSRLRMQKAGFEW